MESFLYLYLGNGRATIAINEKNNSVHIGVAFCSPDDQFIKKYGKELALARLNDRKEFYVCFERNSDRIKQQVHKIIKFIISEKWVTKLDIENELDIVIYALITETVKEFSDNMTVHTNTIPTWARCAVFE